MRPEQAYDARRARPGRQGLAISSHDLYQTAVMLVCDLVTRGLPPSRWQSLARGVARVAIRARPARTATGRAKLRGYFPDGLPGGRRVDQLLTEILAAHVEQTMLYRRLSREASFRPTVGLTGLEHLEEARRRGLGVLLWALPQIFTPLLARMTLHDAKYGVSYLRHWTHGPSATRYGRRVLNPPHWRVEDRFAHHIVIPPTGPTRAVRDVARRLRGGELVMIQGVDLSDSPLTMGLFAGSVELALGAPRLALRTKAALLAVAGRRSGRGFDLSIEPLLTGEEADGRALVLDRAAEGFRDVLERSILASPDLWPIHAHQFRAVRDEAGPR